MEEIIFAWCFAMMALWLFIWWNAVGRKTFGSATGGESEP